MKLGEFDSFPQDLKTSVDSRCNVKQNHKQSYEKKDQM